MKLMQRYLALVALIFMVSTVQAAEKRTLCVYDPGGASGDIFAMMKDFRLKALELGVEFEMKPFVDEKSASDDFKAKQCDAALITGTRARPLHKFSSTIEAMGGLPTYDMLKKTISLLSSAKAAGFMKSGNVEVAGLFPGGAVYLYVRDRGMNSVSKLAGKRMATMNFDKAAQIMVQKVGASMINADVATFAGMFNNGSVDACYAPAFAFNALELYKGVGKKGGVVQYPLAQMTLQLLIHTDRFPAGFGGKTRALAAQSFEVGRSTAKRAEGTIPASAWIEIPKADKAKYDQMFLDVRVELRDKHKVYDAKALKVLRKIRCRVDATRAECAEKRE